MQHLLSQSSVQRYTLCRPAFPHLALPSRVNGLVPAGGRRQVFKLTTAYV